MMLGCIQKDSHACLFLSTHFTVYHSYAALGLALSHNPIQSGGVEHDSIIERDSGTSTSSAATATMTPPLPTISVSSTTTAAAAQSAGSDVQARRRGLKLGRIVRDAEGNVVAVELPEDDDEQDGEDKDVEGQRQRQRRQAAVNNGPDPDGSLKEPELDRVAVQNWAQRTKSSGTAENSVVSGECTSPVGFSSSFLLLLCFLVDFLCLSSNPRLPVCGTRQSFIIFIIRTSIIDHEYTRMYACLPCTAVQASLAIIVIILATFGILFFDVISCLVPVASRDHDMHDSL
jgi:hypothetical protein